MWTLRYRGYTPPGWVEKQAGLKGEKIGLKGERGQVVEDQRARSLNGAKGRKGSATRKRISSQGMLSNCYLMLTLAMATRSRRWTSTRKTSQDVFRTWPRNDE
jgi:hypothetical protein